MGKPPWLVEWGGGASVENPHVQRVHYCQLLVCSIICARFFAAQGSWQILWQASACRTVLNWMLRMPLMLHARQGGSRHFSRMQHFGKLIVAACTM